MTDLGTFVLSSERRRAMGAAVFSAALVVSAFLGAGAATRRWSVAALAPIAGTLAWLLERRRWEKKLTRGTLVLEGDALLLRRKDQTIFKVPLSQAKVSGRTIRVGRKQNARVQVVVQLEDRALVAKLEVPFRPGPIDLEGPLPATIELDRAASRTFDALSYKKLK
jgi:hypothetical protein